MLPRKGKRLVAGEVLAARKIERHHELVLDVPLGRVEMRIARDDEERLRRNRFRRPFTVFVRRSIRERSSGRRSLGERLRRGESLSA